MYQIILVGAGQIGSRHLQALALLNFPCHITLVDPSQQALELAISRYRQISDNYTSITCSNVIPSGYIYDVAIIATGAKERFAAFQQLQQTNTLNNIIFEKVLFQSIWHLRQTAELLAEHDLNAWVNCPRRSFDSYKDLKQKLAFQPSFEMTVKGNNYGLACNGIHFIDLFAFLTGQRAIKMRQHKLHDGFVQAKRAGCYEVFGSLSATSQQNTLHLWCDNLADSVNMEIEIMTPQYRYLINELKQQFEQYNFASGLSETNAFNIPYQSQMTQLVVADIITKGKCDLPTYAESAQHHEQFINTLLSHFNSGSENSLSVCPIS